MNAEHKGTVAFALCGSFCTFEAAVPQAARLGGQFPPLSVDLFQTWVHTIPSFFPIVPAFRPNGKPPPARTGKFPVKGAVPPRPVSQNFLPFMESILDIYVSLWYNVHVKLAFHFDREVVS